MGDSKLSQSPWWALPWTEGWTWGHRRVHWTLTSSKPIFVSGLGRKEMCLERCMGGPSTVEREEPFSGAQMPLARKQGQQPLPPLGWGTPPGPCPQWALTHGLQSEMHKVGMFILQCLVGLHRDIDVAKALLVAHVDLCACRVGQVSIAAPLNPPPLAHHHPHRPPGRSRQRR